MNYHEEILKIISWYNTLGRKYNDIDGLIYSRQKLSSYSVTMAISIGESKKVFEQNYLLRKLGFAKEIERLKKEDSKVPGFMAESKALQKVREYYENEKIASAEYEAEKIILYQVNEVLSSMNSHISYLKKEKETVNVRQTA